MNFRYIGCEVVDCVEMAHNIVHCWMIKETQNGNRIQTNEWKKVGE